ncbi:hypothetical protein POM88_054122 [Heracleum sosnowskyi]|uniref:Spermatogenesis-associated protein 20-like TRX domain-containing protein n=1 Tax=Heracleum sosnowskyi TaxID=360622 RepID=A0AAD8LX62_9APIA|nr:hypothetical protein POM88_054122 [Heracleum sosnowskyi]
MGGRKVVPEVKNTYTGTLNSFSTSIIEVDREERPYVDKVYMTYVQALYGREGWPLSAFLSHDLKPLMGGTYFPPEDKFGMPRFKTILRKVKDAWDSKRDVLIQSGSFAIEQLSEAMSVKAESYKLSKGITQSALRKCAKQCYSFITSQLLINNSSGRGHTIQFGVFCVIAVLDE